MNVFDFISQHQTIISLAAYVVGSAAVSSMPAPRDNASMGYQWFYKFANALAANVTAIRGKAAFEPPPAPPRENVNG